MAIYQHEDEIGQLEDVIPADREPEFLLMHHPMGWEFVEQASGQSEWLPRLKAFRLLSGVNGVKSPKEGGWIHARAEHEAQGWTFIAPDVDVDGVSGYLRSYRGRNGKIYKDRWTTPHVIGKGRNARVSWTFDQAGYDTWRRGLVRDGHVPPIDPAVREEMSTIQRNRVQRRASDAHDGANPILREAQANRVARLEAMTREEVIAATPDGGQSPPVKRGPGRPRKHPRSEGVPEVSHE